MSKGVKIIIPDGETIETDFFIGDNVYTIDLSSDALLYDMLNINQAKVTSIAVTSFGTKVTVWTQCSQTKTFDLDECHKTKIACERIFKERQHSLGKQLMEKLENRK